MYKYRWIYLVSKEPNYTREEDIKRERDRAEQKNAGKLEKNRINTNTRTTTIKMPVIWELNEKKKNTLKSTRVCRKN